MTLSGISVQHAGIGYYRRENFGSLLVHSI